MSKTAMALLKRKSLAAVFIALFLSLMLVGACFAGKAVGQTLPEGFEPLERIYIKADGNVEGTDKIHRAGNVYTLIANISGFEPIIVERDNIVIDGAGYSIIGVENWQFGGFRLEGRTKVTIKNVNIIDSVAGIYLNNSSDNIISNNTLISKLFRAGASWAIRLENFSNYNKIYGNIIEHEKNSTLLFENVVDIQKSLYNEIIGNKITSNTPCIGLDKNFLRSNHTVISGNTITLKGPFFEGLFRDASFWGFTTGFNTTFTNNILIGCSLFIQGSRQNTIANNTVNGKPLVYLNGDSGQVLDGGEAGQIILENCRNIKVKNYDLSNIAKVGIQLLCTNNSEISNYKGSIYVENSFYNLITRSHCVEIALKYSYNNTIARNNITNSESLDYSGGIELEYSQYNTVSKNNITQNSLSCVKLRYSDHNFIIYNDLTHSAHGVSFLEASENTVYSNNIAYHSNVGVSLWGGQGNLIYLNNFIGCHAGGRDARYIWDNGTVGNYWSNYNGTDQDNDGIGDEPYSFNAFSTMGLGDIINTDSYPLMKPPVDIEAMLDFADEEPYILPTMTPDQEPQETELVEIIMVLAVIAIVLGAGVGLLVYLVRRK